MIQQVKMQSMVYIVMTTRIIDVYSEFDGLQWMGWVDPTDMLTFDDGANALEPPL
jgi:hypothetical protein